MAAGQEIISFCSSCKLDLRHVIVAHKSGNSGTIAKVECKTCRKIHAYHAPRGAAGAVSVREQEARVPRAKVQAIPLAVEWNRQLNEATAKAPKTYSIRTVFSKGDVVQHPQFGLGVIQELKDSTKVEVLFENELKILLHNKV